ncbi:predicted protein [Nematostella vectensis]|uniref:Reverse transcriptase domain-containing protein n=1 Tax=Nematostella vectensis TaxID=45351 RepID=A7SK57_NEMVE|nr:predicted protein [Nematostella vectensis]|eukprot:XP_001627946.1 predicted protein [Nematostella vectensis]
MSRGTKKVKWTDQMNKDLLECKRNALGLGASDKAPRKMNGRRKGYIENLRDQAARLEKFEGHNSARNIDKNSSNIDTDELLSSGSSQTPTSAEYNQNNENERSQNANLPPTFRLDLHTPTPPQASREPIDEGSDEMNETISMEVPGSLPDYIPVYSPETIVWGQSSGAPISINSSVIVNAYNEITTWRKNTFLVPYGKIGRDFIDQLTKHLNDWNNRSECQHIALKAFFVLLAIGFQKPSKTSKSKDHQECLGKRLALWKNGNIEELIREGRTIQRRLVQFHRKKDAPQNTAKVFAKLVMEGQINSALRYLTKSDCGGVLSLTDDVMRQLQEKHPNAQPAKLGSLLFGPAEDVHESIYSEITGGMIREAALRTKGAGGPSNVDAHGFQRILASKSFKKSSSDLCDALALLTRRLYTEYTDPMTIEPILASRLIPLDKGKSETDAVMLVDASNAFNSVNRAAALPNIRVLCPTLAPFVINTYRLPARLFVERGKELVSAEGTTQGDPLAMSMCALSLQPLISRLQAATQVNQCWFADDATGCGSLDDVRQWWDTLQSSGPDLGYFPNAVKCWLVTKPEKEESARKIFEGTGINITTEGRKHLGAALGSRPHLEQYVDSKVDEWVGQVTKLAEFSVSQPQASYAAYTFGLKHRWTYFLRTLPDIEDLLLPLERAISDTLIPSLTGRTCTQTERDLLALPVRFGGLGITNPAGEASLEFTASTKVCGPLAEQIKQQTHELPCDDAVQEAQQEARREKNEYLKSRCAEVKSSLPVNMLRAVDLATQKGASSWLTVLPLLIYKIHER